ncbi:hypothetical protein D3C81_2240740 [compost metagenome]
MGFLQSNPCYLRQIIRYRQAPALAEHIAENTVHEPGYSLMPPAFSQIDGLVHRSMRRNPVQIADLVEA